MPSVFLLLACTVILTACTYSTANTVAERDDPDKPFPAAKKDTGTLDITTQIALKEYDHIVYDTTEVVQAAPGTKSVLFNQDGSRLYAMNLEGMSIYEFNRTDRSIRRAFRFKPTPATGWDYETSQPIPSFEEKPVEACLSHDDRILWVSLHNAGGIVPIHLDSNTVSPNTDEKANKKIYITSGDSGKIDSLYIPLIKTGRTPKIIARTADSRHLLVSNWHSANVSILETDVKRYPFARIIKKVPVPSIPRGIAVDDDNHRSFVAIMGGASIDVINNSVWMKEKTIKVSSNPRHIVMDSAGHIFVSYNRLGRISCLDADTGKPLFSATTAAQPRTIMLSKNQKFLFVTCYSSDTLEVFRVEKNRFAKLISLPCPGHPVGVDIYENNNKLEAWVCSYNRGAISIFNFLKK